MEMDRRSRLWIVPVMVGLLALTACGGDGSAAGRKLSGAVREPAPVVSATTLDDALNDNAPASLIPEPGDILLVYFGYTYCPDICPTTLATLSRALDDVSDDELDRVEVAMVSVDPERDTPEVLADQVDHFLDGVPNRLALRTDDPARLEEVTDSLGVVATKEPYGDGPDEYEMAHSAQVFAINSDGEVVVEWTFGTESGPIARDIETLLADEAAADESARSN